MVLLIAVAVDNERVNCLACGETSSPASKEHVFSKWLLKELQYLNAPMALYRAQPDGSSTQVRVPVRLDTFKLKQVCEPCNNGWMSRLEDITKPILLGIVNGGRTLDSLDEEERRILAKWAGKTAIIESYAVGAESPVDPEVLRWMGEREQARPLASLGHRLLHQIFLAHVALAKELDLDAGSGGQLLGILPQLFAEWLGKFGLVENSHLLSLQIRGHSFGVADFRQRTKISTRSQHPSTPAISSLSRSVSSSTSTPASYPDLFGSAMPV